MGAAVEVTTMTNDDIKAVVEKARYLFAHPSSDDRDRVGLDLMKIIGLFQARLAVISSQVHTRRVDYQAIVTEIQQTVSEPYPSTE